MFSGDFVKLVVRYTNLNSGFEGRHHTAQQDRIQSSALTKENVSKISSDGHASTTARLFERLSSKISLQNPHI